MDKQVYEFENEFQVEEEQVAKPMISLANISRKKLQRHELRFPTFRFIVVDDWLKKLGNDSFCLYLELFTMADRTDTDRDVDKLPTSMKSLMKRLGVSKPTFYKRVKPLYEYGLIDFIEFEESKLKGQKPINIIVFEAPWNEEENIKKPLVKLRSWEDRTREQFPNAIKGGQKKSELAKEKRDNTNVLEGGKKNYPTSGKKNYPTSGKKNDHNNVLNNNNNVLNPNNNSLNVNNIVNKEVSNEVVNNGEEKLTKDPIANKVLEDVKDLVTKGSPEEQLIREAENLEYEIYKEITKTHKMSKDKFKYLYYKPIRDKIAARKVYEVLNVKRWIIGSFGRIDGHRYSKTALPKWKSLYGSSTNENEEEVAVTEEELSQQSDYAIQAEDHMPKQQVPTDEELLDLLNGLRDKE